MRIFPFLVSVACTAGLVITLNTQLPMGSGKTPRLGYFLSPQHGFWQNAESADAAFDGEIKVPGLKDKVDVYMDERLVPHIYAANDEDAYYVQGYLHAKFRLWQMEFQTHVAAGRLSEIVGKDRIATDRFFRRLGMVYGAEQTMQKMNADPAMKATIEAYSAGVNAYIRSLKPEQIPLEYKLLNYKPEEWTPFKTYLFLMYMSYDLSARGTTTDLQMTNAKNYLGFDAFDLLYPNSQDSLDPILPKGTVYGKPSYVPVMPAGADSAYFGKNSGNSTAVAPIVPDKNNGSNNWAVSGSKTKSGKPILCNDPHLGLNLPSLWYEVQINTPTHNTYGASFPGSPAVIIGFNDSIAWGVTNAGRDVIDYYDIRFKDSSMQEYWYNNEWKHAGKRTEVIKVNGGEDLVENIAMTVFGPVMYDGSYKNASTEGKYLAVRWTAPQAGTGLQSFYLLNRAKNYDDYLDATASWRCPGQNFVYASIAGDIAIKQQGAFIARWNRQGDFIMPGTDSSYAWQAEIPSVENPLMLNPARGFVSSANQMPTDNTYPYYPGAATNFPLYRGIIINRKLAAMNNITPEDMQQMQTDNYNVFAEMARPVMLKYIDESALDEKAKGYVALLRSWNLRNDIDEKGATVFRCMWDSMETQIWGDELLNAKKPLPWPDESTLLESLLRDSVYRFADNINTTDKVESLKEVITLACKKAAVYLQEMEKDNRLAWGRFKETKVQHLLQLPAFSRLHLPIGGGTHIINATTATHGPSWRMIVHLTDTIEAYGVYPGGQNGNPGSKYYDSFIDTWAQGRYYKLLFLRKEAAAKQTKWHLSFVNG
ncbi:penicillin acylase family protein [Sediminibacterium ginsengisoli]|uniref:Penicillin amidase n=1 Tax=Sediminibacterium ginsengisoli TaxID=413434 RepID=A0A1T4L899_9BACT|nr:penicillin acylase family protein [Sediminibacterium ginsengisoli]SJZ50985.1 penicillin amidase [Sediminibacterium ginsengisoli]